MSLEKKSKEDGVSDKTSEEKKVTSQLENTKEITQVYKRLMRRGLPYWYAFAWAVFGYVIYGITHPMSVKLIEEIIDSINQPRTELHNLFPIAIIVIFIFRGIGTLMGSYGMAYLGRHVVYQFRIDMFSKLLDFPVSYFAKSSPGHLVSHITFNAEQVAGTFSHALTIMVREGIVVISLLAYLFYMNWKLTLIFLVVLPPVSLIVNYVNKRFRKLSRSIQNSMGDVTQVSSEVINAYQEVRVYGTLDFENKRFDKVSSNNMKKSLKFALTNSVSAPVVQLLVAMALSVIVWLALNPEIMGDVTAGSFTAFILAASLLDKPTRELIKVNGILQKGIAAGQSIFKLLDENLQEDRGAQEINACRGDIEFRHVSFSYGDDMPRVLDDISFTAKAGETIALVGRSGGGKSSLVSLIPRFYEISEGEILLDGINIKELKLSNLRSHIALVSQKVMLFNNSVYHNIAYGDLANANEESVKNAARMAYAEHFIEQLPQGYQTIVGQDGIQLSGGQRQRIAIARALLKNSSIIIMDEATSALDNESEAMIQRALENIQGNRTLIVIAHRLSTIENADRILVIDQGKIVEQGKHQELLQRNGVYARLHRNHELFVEPETLENPNS